MTGHELTFKQPYTELHPYYKDLVRCFRKHEFCILDFEALLDPTFNNDHQIEAFRCAIREASNEKDRNVIVDDTVMQPNIIFELAPKGHPGSLPEVWSQEDEMVAVAVNGQDPKKFLI